MTIYQIEALTEETIQPSVLEHLIIKEHDCYLCNFGYYFGYSIVIFKDKRQIFYANDYQLHHTGRTIDSLRDFYIKEMNNKLFTDDELLEGCKNYEEYEKKKHFLQNYWIMRYDHLSIFGIGEKAKREFEEQKPEYPYYNSICFCYVKDENIVHNACKYYRSLENEFKRMKNDNDTFKQMIRQELSNHEACITMDYRDALASLGLTFSALTAEQRKIVKEELSRQIQMYG